MTHTMKRMNRTLGTVASALVAGALIIAASAPAQGAERSGGTLTVARVGFVQRQTSGNGQQEVVIEGWDHYSSRRAQVQLGLSRSPASDDAVSACERYALIAMSRPSKWLLSFSVSASNPEGATLDNVQKDKNEWRVLHAQADKLGDVSSYLRCTLQPN